MFHKHSSSFIGSLKWRQRPEVVSTGVGRWDGCYKYLAVGGCESHSFMIVQRKPDKKGAWLFGEGKPQLGTGGIVLGLGGKMADLVEIEDPRLALCVVDRSGHTALLIRKTNESDLKVNN